MAINTAADSVAMVEIVPELSGAVVEAATLGTESIGSAAAIAGTIGVELNTIGGVGNGSEELVLTTLVAAAGVGAVGGAAS